MHFQYNGFIFGVYLLSAWCIVEKGWLKTAGALYVFLFTLKHIFLYVALVYFVYLLFEECVAP